MLPIMYEVREIRLVVLNATGKKSFEERVDLNATSDILREARERQKTAFRDVGGDLRDLGGR